VDGEIDKLHLPTAQAFPVGLNWAQFGLHRLEETGLQIDSESYRKESISPFCHLLGV
jgi:hypothetical protein